MNAHAETGDACELRFGQVGVATVRLRRVDAAALCEELERRVVTSPKLFARTAVILDLSLLHPLPDDGTVDALLEAIRSAGMLPVGLAYGTGDTEALAMRMDLPIIAKFRTAYEAVGAPAPTTPSAPSREVEPIPAGPGAQRFEGTVRSGQQIYARERDLVIVGSVANGAEVIADGDIHVYGSLRGRAMAGAQGRVDARLFITDFCAELVAIAGHYRVFEQIPSDLANQAVQCRLEDGKLLLEKL